MRLTHWNTFSTPKYFQHNLVFSPKGITDVEKHFPGLLKATIEWFRIYKIPDGKPENQFAFGGEPKPAEFALKVLAEVHGYWKKLISRETNGKDISL